MCLSGVGGISEECEETERMILNLLDMWALFMPEISYVYILICSNTQKYEKVRPRRGGIGPVRTVGLRIQVPIQYLLMGTAKVKKKIEINAQDTRRDRTKSYGKHHPGVGGWVHVQAR